MKLFGLTGGIACGKSTVAKFLSNDLNVPIVDADVIARQIVEVGQPAYKEIVESFGNGILLENGSLDRPKLGKIIFEKEKQRRCLNAITHKYVYREILKKVLKLFLRGHKYIVLDIPLLFETSPPASVPFWKKAAFIQSYLAASLVVNIPRETQIKRLIERNSLSEEECISRIDAQMPLSTKCKLADYVIDNAGTIEDTRAITRQIWTEATKEHPSLLTIPVLLILFIVVFAVFMLILSRR